MLAKLSVRNVRRSFSDYAIYFLTLTFGVSLFYSFNSIPAQKVLLELSITQTEMIAHMMTGIEIVSVFISCVLAFLILYANQFLVKRRKKELGLYQTLGMSKFDISRLFMVETFVIGLIALGSGLFLGIVISQGLSVLTSALFDAEILAYRFVFSFSAMLKTILYFGIIFFIVMIFNTVIISRFTLLELLYGSKKNDRFKIKNSKVIVGLFLTSVMMILIGYVGLCYFGLSNGLIFPIVFSGSIIIGTFLWFYSLAGFILQMVMKKKSLYYKDLNLFLLRQVSSKIHTTFFSMVMICFMLTGTLTLLSAGFGYKKAMDEELKLVTPYDVTFKSYVWPEEMVEKPYEIEQFLQSNNITLEEMGEVVSLHYYVPKLNASSLLEPYITEKQYSSYFTGEDDTVYAIRQSDYVQLATLQGMKPISMNKDEVIVFTNKKPMMEGIENFIKKAPGIEIGNHMYNIANNEVLFLSIENTEVPRDMMMIVIPDEAAKNLEQRAEVIVANYTKDAEIINQKLNNLFEYVRTPEYEGFDYVLPYTKTYVYHSSQGYTGTLIFVGIYIGLIFLVSSAAILTLQQLSEASDNLVRYKTLKRIGVAQNALHRVIFKQILIYFMLPLVLALFHSMTVVGLIAKLSSDTANWSIVVPALWTSGILLVVYGGYFFATYKGYKSIVK